MQICISNAYLQRKAKEGLPSEIRKRTRAPGSSRHLSNHQGKEPLIYFWRTSAGSEVDLVVDHGLNLIPVEVKLSTTPSRSMAKGIEAFRKDFGKKAAQGYVVHPGDLKLPLGPDALAWPFAEF